MFTALLTVSHQPAKKNLETQYMLIHKVYLITKIYKFLRSTKIYSDICGALPLLMLNFSYLDELSLTKILQYSILEYPIP